MILHIVAAILILMYFASPALGDTIVFGWRSPEGAHEFTDDINRVPVANLDEVRQFNVDGLEAYERYTRDDNLFAPNPASEDRAEATIATEEVVAPPPETAPERRRKEGRNPNKR